MAGVAGPDEGRGEAGAEAVRAGAEDDGGGELRSGALRLGPARALGGPAMGFGGPTRRCGRTPTWQVAIGRGGGGGRVRPGRTCPAGAI